MIQRTFLRFHLLLCLVLSSYQIISLRLNGWLKSLMVVVRLNLTTTSLILLLILFHKTISVFMLALHGVTPRCQRVLMASLLAMLLQLFNRPLPKLNVYVLNNVNYQRLVKSRKLLICNVALISLIRHLMLVPGRQKNGWTALRIGLVRICLCVVRQVLFCLLLLQMFLKVRLLLMSLVCCLVKWILILRWLLSLLNILTVQRTQYLLQARVLKRLFLLRKKLLIGCVIITVG